MIKYEKAYSLAASYNESGNNDKAQKERGRKLYFCGS